jgi:thiol-disulfide isomerase/thioredoxin
VKIDDFSTYAPLFRPVPPPFFNYTKSILRYMLATQDNIDIESEESADHYYYKLTINEDRQVEFFGRAHYMPDNSQFYGETTSVYKLWVRKSTGLPYKIQREMSHNVSATTCLTEPEINKLSAEGFTAYDYIPQNYEVRKYGETANTPTIDNLIGKTAPRWTLTDMDENMVSSTTIKSKVVLLNFTGIGCGPCLASIPFLVSLKEKYSTDDLELVAFECWKRPPSSLRAYAKEHKMNYPFLCATDELLQDFQTGRGVPVYVLLDENRIVREIFTGYGSETSDKQITDAINRLL